MENYKIYKNTRIGPNFNIGFYVILGHPPRGKSEGEMKTIIGANAIIRSHTIIYAGNTIGDNLQTGHNVMIREENKIGDNVSIGTSTIIEHHVIIENNVRIHSQTFIPEYSILEEGCWLGPNVVLTNALHPLCPKVPECIKGPTIKKNVKIGANATLSPDIVIGEGSLIGSGSVVVKDVPSGVVVAGNPAKIIKNINELNCPYDLIEKPY